MAFSPDWFFEQARLGNMFHACSAGAVTLSTVSTTCTGLALSNPWGSGKNLVLKDVNFSYTTVPTATAVVFLACSIAASATAHATVTSLNVYNCKGNVAVTSNAGRAYSASTTPNLPVYSRTLGYSPTTPATTGGLTFTDKVDGQVILVPGTYAQISYITTAPVGITMMSWAETDEE